ncbi:MAG: hypothetical protein WA982_12885, partial [Rubrobacteraceae bacterium]
MALVVFVFVYGLALWLGLYLIGRDPRNPKLCLTGLGLMAYAVAVAGDLLAIVVPVSLSAIIEQVRWPLLMLPALFWTGTLVHLIPEENETGIRLRRIWPLAVCAVIAGLVLARLFTGVVAQAGVPQTVIGVAVLMIVAALGVYVWWTWRGRRAREVAGVLVVFTMFLLLSTALLLLPYGWLPETWTLLSIGTDVISLGFAIAYFDAFESGETLLPDMVRSFDAAWLAALFFAGPVGMVIWLSTGATLPMLLLLLATLTTAVVVSTLPDRISVVLDRVALGRLPNLRQARTELRTTARSIQRRDPTLDPATLKEDEFIRITRRALSNFGDLPRLSASPLINLFLIDHRLPTQSASDNPLERAAELKTVLSESIDRLKPRNGADFGTSDEWRYYNALYFPYVIGIKPYSSRARNYHKNPEVREAMEWF